MLINPVTLQNTQPGQVPLAGQERGSLWGYTALLKSKINVIKSRQHNCRDLYPMTFDNNKVGTLQISSTFTTLP